MKKWWQLNKEVIPSGSTQSEVENFKSEAEDLTGCILLLLDRCVVNGKMDLSATALKDVFTQVQNFITGIRDNQSVTESAWER